MSKKTRLKAVQLVAEIRSRFPRSSTRATMWSGPGYTAAADIAAVMALVDQLDPAELESLKPEDRVAFAATTEKIRFVLAQWRSGDRNVQLSTGLHTPPEAMPLGIMEGLLSKIASTPASVSTRPHRASSRLVRAGPRRLSTSRDFILIKQLTEGANGVVWVAEDLAGIKVAVKRLKADRRSSETLTRFRNEIAFCSRNTHPNIVTVLASRVTTKQQFYVMPLMEGNLRTLLKRKVSFDNLLRYFEQALDGLEAAHQKDVIHRDLKPENLLYDQGSDRLVVADFGIASFRDELLYSLAHTKPGRRMANFSYCAPEQRPEQRGERVTPATDVYAMGLILNELFTGIVPFGTDPKRVRDVDPAFAWVDEVVAHMTQADATRRPQSVGDVRRLMRQRPRPIAGVAGLVGGAQTTAVVQPHLTIEYVEGGATFLQTRPGERSVRGLRSPFVQRLFRVGVRNESPHATAHGVRVVLLAVQGKHASHLGIVPNLRLRVMELGTNETQIHPRSTSYFDVAVHELEKDLHAVNDLRICYAVEPIGDSLPTDPGTEYLLTLQVQAEGIAAEDRTFRLWIDQANVAHLSETPSQDLAPKATRPDGVEMTFSGTDFRFVYDVDDRRTYQVGLRSTDESSYATFVTVDKVEPPRSDIRPGARLKLTIPSDVTPGDGPTNYALLFTQRVFPGDTAELFVEYNEGRSRLSSDRTDFVLRLRATYGGPHVHLYQATTLTLYCTFLLTGELSISTDPANRQREIMGALRSRQEEE